MAEILDTFHAFSGILVVCPCCGDLMRLSDLNLRYTGKFERTVLDALRQKGRALQKKQDSVDRRLEKFETKEGQLREEAVGRGRQKARRLIRRLDPSMSKLRYDPKDIKVISYPVDLIVFDGLNDGDRIKNVVFIARSKARNVKALRRSIEKALADERYIWETIRVQADGTVEVSNK